LKNYFQSKNPTGRLARWVTTLQQYDKMTIEYIPGKDNTVADSLSRLPQTTHQPVVRMVLPSGAATQFGLEEESSETDEPIADVELFDEVSSDEGSSTVEPNETAVVPDQMIVEPETTPYEIQYHFGNMLTNLNHPDILVCSDNTRMSHGAGQARCVRDFMSEQQRTDLATGFLECGPILVCQYILSDDDNGKPRIIHIVSPDGKEYKTDEKFLADLKTAYDRVFKVADQLISESQSGELHTVVLSSGLFCRSSVPPEKYLSIPIEVLQHRKHQHLKVVHFWFESNSDRFFQRLPEEWKVKVYGVEPAEQTEVDPIPENLIITDEKMRSEQQTDEFCQSVKERMAGRGTLKLPIAVRPEQFCIQNGLLFRISRAGLPNRLVIPKSLVPLLLSQSHDHPMSGHLGIDKTIGRLQQRYYWHNFIADVHKYIKSCDKCQANKYSNRPHHPMQPIEVPTLPFRMLGLDAMGPLPMTFKRNRFVLVFMDYFTKYCEVYPVRSIEANVVAEKLIDVISRHGFPRVLLTDQGTNFTGKVLRDVNRLLSIEKRQTTTFWPQCDGLVERFNRTLAEMIRSFANKRSRDWDMYINPLLFAYRTSPQASTGISPFELVYGRLPELHTDVDLSKDEQLFTDVSDYRTQVVESIKVMRDLATENIEKAQVQQKSLYDRASREISFDVGQKVMRRIVPVPHKLKPRYEGPYVVLRKTGPVNYAIQLDNPAMRSPVYIVNVNNLIPYTSRVTV